MKTRNILVLLLLPIALATLVSASSDNGGERFNSNNGNNKGCVTLRIRNIKHKHGTVWLAFFRNAANFLKKGKEAYVKPIRVKTDQQDVTTICSLEQGWYAISAFQDLDENGNINLNFIGVPTEPYGFSNNARPILSAPSFKQCQFYVDRNKPIVLDIDLVNP